MQAFRHGPQLVSKGEAEPRDTWDFCFLGAKNRISEAELEQRGDSPVLVMHDGATMSIFAHLIPAKGVDFTSF